MADRPSTNIIPVIDFSSPNRQEKAQQILTAMESVGFLFLDKVPGHDEQELKKWVDWFWSLSKEKKLSVAKRRYNRKNKHVRTSKYYIYTDNFETDRAVCRA